jgi:hypothetical protein
MSASHSELLQFDWRALSVLGSSTFSGSNKDGDVQNGGVPIVQLKLDVASKRLTTSTAPDSDTFEAVLATCPVPQPKEDGAQLVYPTHSLVCELDAAMLDEAISSLHSAIIAASANATA